MSTRHPRPKVPGTPVYDYVPRARTKPTTGDIGPRDRGPHGKTLEQQRIVDRPTMLRDIASVFGRGERD
jgi:hypothetical protein